MPKQQCYLWVQLHAGRRIGEQSEQAWAFMKNLHHRQRYMAPCNRQDFIDDALGQVANDKFWSFPDLLLNLFQNAVKAIGKPTDVLSFAVSSIVSPLQSRILYLAGGSARKMAVQCFHARTHLMSSLDWCPQRRVSSAAMKSWWQRGERTSARKICWLQQRRPCGQTMASPGLQRTKAWCAHICPCGTALQECTYLSSRQTDKLGGGGTLQK